MTSSSSASPGPIKFVEPPSTTTSSASSSSFSSSSSTAPPHLILYCLPHAGGSPSSFREWQKYADNLLGQGEGGGDSNSSNRVQIRVLSLPGRGGRFDEAPWDDWGFDDPDDDVVVNGNIGYTPTDKDTLQHVPYRGKFISALTQAFLSDWDGMTPYAFFGHSFGTLLSYELILQIDRLQIRPPPLATIVSAHRAPGVSPELGGIAQTHTLPRDKFVECIRNWGLVPDTALDDDELVDIMVPALRADLKLDETHVPPTCAANCDNGDDGGVRKLPVPMVVYGGTKDQTVPSHQLEAWMNMSPPSSGGGDNSSGGSTYDEVWFDGDHFYTVTHLAELMADLGKRLKRLLDDVERSIMVGGALGRTSCTTGSRKVTTDKDHCLIKLDDVNQEEDGNEINKVTAGRVATENGDDDSLAVLDLFFAQLRRTPNFLAMVDETGKEWSYTEVGGAVVNLGEYLIRVVDGEEVSRSVDVSAGPATAENNASKQQHPVRVGIFLHHASAYLLANLSSWYAGCSVVLLERNWTGALLREFIDLCKVDVVITDEDGMERLGGAGLSDEECGHVEIVEEEEKKDASAESSTIIQSRPCPRIVIVSSGGVTGLNGSVSGSVKYGPKGMEPDDVAFVSMTSGSTGKPSAVLTTHRGTKFCFEARYKLYPYRTTPEELQEREGANVFFAWESFRPLLRGHVTVIIPDDVILSPPHFVNFLRKNKITRLVVTPSLLESVFTYPHLGETLHEKLDHMYGWFLMGEVVPMRLIERAEELLPNDVQLINAYSSWEALDVSYSDLLPLKQCQIKLGDTGDNGHSGLADASAIDKTPPYAPVGYPIPKVYALLLDEYDRPVPRGVPGTLHILTPALALGYLDDQAKTSTRFRRVPPQVSAALLNVHPDVQWCQLGLDEGQDALLFNSGDVGRVLPDGQLGLLGRGDDTVKLRGYKVGIPFVESTLNGIDGVVASVVLPILDDISQQPDFLIAYIIGREGKPTDKELDAIAKCSRELLPPYAVPRDFIGLAKLPLRAGESRKLDKNALPVPPSLIKKRERIVKGHGEGGRNRPTEQQQAVEEPKKARSDPALYQKPTNRLEQIISQAWVQTLHLDHEDAEVKAGAVSRTDNFFDVGGNSLLASELIGCLSSQYGLPLSVIDLYEHSSLGDLIGYCQGLSKERADANTNDLKTSKHSSLRHRRRKFRSSAKYSGKIAIVGISGKFPGAPTLAEFWQNIQSGKDSLRTFSKAELAAHGLSPDVYNNPKWIPVGQVLDDADKFDATFWDISPREAKMMDPQHRVFLEVAWSALEDAGYPPRSSPDGPRTGVWAACGIDGYLVHHLKGGGLTTPLDPSKLFLTEVGNEKDYISTRVSYALDLGGPSMTVTSACSSGLVAVAQAAQSLMVGQIDVAIAGASSLTFPNVGYCYEEGMVGSADGHVRPFDEDASGTLFGDGVGAIVLKRLEDAIEDGDYIWSLLTGFDITNDGRQKAGYAAPSASAQAAAIVGAMDMAGVSSEQISYVECHATATHVGDAIELRGLSEAFQATAERQGIPHRCALGSVKGNIGHANCAAGISGLIKTVMMLKNRVITPTAHFARPNAKLTDYLDQQTSPFYINRALKPWDVTGEQLPRRAGVSSFGIGGTNAHVVLEDFIGSTPNHQEQETCYGSALNDASNVCILPISGKTIGALKRNVDNMAAHLKSLVQVGDGSTTTSSESIPLLRNIAYTLQCGREAFPKRACVVARSHEEAAPALEKLASSALLQEDDATKYLHAEPASIVMCFPGQGSHYCGMARALYNDEQGIGRFFREYFDEICAKFKAHLNFELHDAVFAQDNDTFKKPEVTQPAIFAVELALAQSLMGLGIQPVAVAGHSIGEYVAATVAGVLKVEDAVMLVAERAKATAELATGEGAMLFAKLSSENAKVVIEQHRGLSLAIAAINGPEHIVISGSTQAIDVLAESLKSDGVLCRRLKVTHAFHSDMMAPVATRLVQCANTIQVGASCISLTSNVTGRWISGGSDNEMSDPEYWGRHVVGTVRWKENVDAILRWSPTAAIEVGPGNTLITLLSKCMAASAGTAQMPLTKTFTSLPHARDQSSDDCTVFNRLLADLWEEGVDINWTLYNRGCLEAGQSHRSECIPLQRVPLPTYSFEKTSHWTNAKASIYVTAEEELAPVYKVDWQLFKEIPASSIETNAPRTSPMIVTLGPDEITINEAIVEATRSVHGVVLVMQYPVDILEGPLHYSSLQSYEIDMGWSFLRFVQDLTVHTTSGRITMICPASLLGALSVGASRSVVQEYPNLHLTRIFMPIPDHFAPNLCLQDTSSNFNLLLDCCKGQTDVLIPDGLVTGGRILAQTLKPMPLTNTRPKSRPRPIFAIDDGDYGIYIITGGTGALGQALIKRLVLQHDVPEERILLLSRNRKAKGKPFPNIRTIQVDCSDPLQLKSNKEIQSIQAVSGIFHLAGSLDDAVVVNQSRERLSKVVAPKAAITTLLEIAQKQEWNPKFVFAYSSTTSLLGYAGQSNYGAANAILDQMATWQGYSTPIIAVNWGSWGEIGMAAEGTKAYNTSIRQGDLPMSTSAAIGALEALFENLFTQSTVSGQYAITGMNWAVSPWRTHPILRNILETEQQQGKDPSSTSSSAIVPAVVSSSADIQQSVEAVLSNHLSRWDPKETLAALGLDSLDLLQLVRDVSNTFAIEIGLQDVMRSGQTLSEFVQYVVKQVKCIC